VAQRDQQRTTGLLFAPGLSRVEHSTIGVLFAPQAVLKENVTVIMTVKQALLFGCFSAWWRQSSAGSCGAGNDDGCRQAAL